MVPTAFFTQEGPVFKPTDHCRGPWDENACHAGPPTGMLARALEKLIPNQRLTRITVELLRPIPFEGFTIKGVIKRLGKTVSTSSAELYSMEGNLIVTANGLHMREQELHNFPTHQRTFGNPDDATEGKFPIQTVLHNKPAFNGKGVTVRYPRGEDHQPGPTTAWLNTVPLLESETPSPFQRMCPMADCGNAFSRNADPKEVAFVNTDLTVLLHRDPVGEWLGSSTEGYWEPNGIGLADALLFDQTGVVGRALQTLLLRPNYG